MKDEFLDYLQDILNEITSIEDFVEGVDFNSFTDPVLHQEQYDIVMV